MVIASVFGFSDRVRDTLLFLFVVIPLTLLWMATLAHIVLRRDLARLPRLAWLAVVAFFPFVGTIVYLVSQHSLQLIERLPGAAIGQAATTAGEMGAALDHFATTASLAQSMLVQCAGMIEDLATTLDRADATLGFTVPFTRIRPLGPAHAEVRALGAKSRTLGRTLERTADALGTNVTDLRSMAGDVATLANALGSTPGAFGHLPGRSAAPRLPAMGQPAADALLVQSGPERIAINGASEVPAPPTSPPDPVPSP
jgi:hypothetical protein